MTEATVFFLICAVVGGAFLLMEVLPRLLSEIWWGFCLLFRCVAKLWRRFLNAWDAAGVHDEH